MEMCGISLSALGKGWCMSDLLHSSEYEDVPANRHVLGLAFDHVPTAPMWIVRGK